jgi:hypothetical protein
MQMPLVIQACSVSRLTRAIAIIENLNESHTIESTMLTQNCLQPLETIKNFQVITNDVNFLVLKSISNDWPLTDQMGHKTSNLKN